MASPTRLATTQSQLFYALFDTSEPSVEEVIRDEVLDTDWFWNLADYYEVGMAP